MLFYLSCAMSTLGDLKMASDIKIRLQKEMSAMKENIKPTNKSRSRKSSNSAINLQFVKLIVRTKSQTEASLENILSIPNSRKTTSCQCT